MAIKRFFVVEEVRGGSCSVSQKHLPENPMSHSTHDNKFI